MKKYTMPTVEITAFDVEDVIMTSGGGAPNTSLGGDLSGVDVATATSDLNAEGYVVVQW